MSDLERELLYRLLEAGDGTDTLHVGGVPPGFPITLPPGVRLLGSREQTFPVLPDAAGMQFRRLNHTRVLLDSPLPVAEFIAQMRASLGSGHLSGHLNTGWEASEWPLTPHRGFLPAEAEDSLSVYHPALEKMLIVRATQTANAAHVTLELYDQSGEERARMRQFERPQQPALTPVRVPAGATLYPGGGSSGNNHASSDAVIESRLSADDLLDFFGAQLVEKGCQPLTRSQTATTTAASWTDGRGALTFIALETLSQSHHASMIVTRPASGESGSASSSYVVRS